MTEQMPDNGLTPRQRAQYDATEETVGLFGKYDQTTSADGAHYAPADANPFTAEGLVCSNCVFFEGGQGCEVVDGQIDANGVCKLWIIPETLLTAGEPLAAGASINYEARILAANVESRQITGLIVPFSQVGNTSAGPVQFAPGAFGDVKASDIVLNLEHDRTRPIGRGIDGTERVSPGGIAMTFQIAATTAGTDALIEAADGLRTGISIEANPTKYAYKGAIMHVTAAQLKGAGLVTFPAFDAARVSSVVAADPDPDSAPAEAAQPIQENTEMSEQPITAPDIEAAEAPAVQAAAAPVYTKPRHGIVTGADYIKHSVLAFQGDDESRQWIKAADDSTSTNTGLTLPQHLQEFYTNTISDRPAIDAVSRQALVSSGMTFTIPNLGTAPTVAATSEGSAPSETGMTSAYLTGTVVKYAGSNDVSFELIDRSSPEFWTELQTQLGNAYAKATDTAVLTALAASGTQASTQAGTAAGFIAYVGKESAAAFAASKKKARNLVMNTDWWGTLLAATDSTGRPMFTASNPQNNPGVASVDSITGNVMGLNAYVDPYVAASGLVDDSAFIIAPETVTWYESGTTRLQVTMIETGQLRVGIYGYGCVLVKDATGIRRYNLT